MPIVAPTVSVLMAVHNGERHLRSAIESILEQTWEDFEFVIVDDGSTDGTPELLAECERADRRIVTHRIPHSGLPVALNLGCRRCRAELVARIDVDDPSLPQRLEVQLQFLDEHDEVALLGGDALLINERGEVFDRHQVPTSDADLRRALATSSPFYHSNVIFERRVVERVGGYRAAFDLAEDYDLWLRVAEQSAIANLAECISECRFSAEQRSVRQIRAQAVAMVAARLSARDRSGGKADRLGGVARIDADLLVSLGVAERELAETEVHLGAWYAEKLAGAGELDNASAMWAVAVASAESPGVSPALRDRVRRGAELHREAAARREQERTHGTLEAH